MKSAKRKICVVTGSRADYGLLYYLLRDICADLELELLLVVTGMHLSPEFGLTYRQIEKDGFRIDARVEMLVSSDSSIGLAKSIGLGVIGFADRLDELKPDLMVLLGDRYEIFAAAQAALVMKIPIAHISGGETTEGAFDEAIRHSLSKMAQLHFASSENYRRRIIQLGESPDRVFNLGALGLDHIYRMEWLDRSSLETSLGRTLRTPLFVVTYHPETLGSKAPEDSMTELLAALECFPDADVVLTYPNSDTGGRRLIEMIDAWVTNNAERASGHVSLGQQRYLSLLREADVVIGNSSSALTEAPALNTIAVNIGSRQTGRDKAPTVIDAAENRESIRVAITQALDPVFIGSLASSDDLARSAGASHRIKNVLKNAPLHTRKSFYDIKFEI